MVKCPICGEKFDANAEPFIKVSERRYAHKKCVEQKEQMMTQEDKDKEALYNYIMNLFQTDFVNPMVQKQIKEFVEQYKYTYTGIHKALIYFFEIKKGSIEKANGRISIVPHVYQQAYRYYYSLWEAQQRNENKVIEEYIPEVKEIIIPVPQIKPKKRKLFSFLDEEGAKNEF